MSDATEGTDTANHLSCYPNHLSSIPTEAYGLDCSFSTIVVVPIDDVTDIVSQIVEDIVSSVVPPIHFDNRHQVWLLYPSVLLASCLLEATDT